MWLLATLALAQSSDVVQTTVGAQATYSESLANADVDAVVGERLRWSLSDVTRLWVDGQFTYDTDAAQFERSRVRSLGLTTRTGSVQWWLGRHPVRYGGPRLVDGIQGVLTTGALEVGAWGGLAPDLFTTRPELRPGGGPILGLTAGPGQLTLVGEATTAEGGLDRASTLLTGRVQAGRRFDASGRVDWQLTDVTGASGLSDASLWTQWRPHDAFRVDAMGDAWSSLRYRRSALLDPTVQRWVERTQPLVDPLPGEDEALDPTVHAMVGVRPELTVADARLSVLTRYRPGAATEQYARVQPLLRLPPIADGRLELAADANLVWLDTGLSASTGPTVLVELLADRSLWIDGSIRGVFDPAYVSTGMYADAFVDWLGPAGLVLMAGAAYELEPLAELNDAGLTALVRVQHRFRRPTFTPLAPASEPVAPETRIPR